MAKPTPNPEPQRNRDRLAAQLEAINGLRRPSAAAKPAPASPPPATEPPAAPGKQPAPANLGIWRDEATRREIEELTRDTPPNKSAKQPPAPSVPDAAEELFEELERTKAENEELRILLEEANARAASTGESSETAEGEQPWAEREKEYEYLLEEKSGVIRELHLRISELEAQGGAGGAPAAPPTQNEQELLAMSDELERERCQLEQERRQMEEERRQLKEDEQGMMTQMREMEVLMARERAELARQRNELQRLHGEIRHEIEVAQRDGLLNERLKTLQRKHQEVSSRKGGAPEPGMAAEKDTEAAPPKDPSKKDSSVLRRLFRKK